MRQNPLLSIVVTSYTVQRLSDVYELLDSIRNQTYKNIETIFVAERSKELYERVKTYAEKKGMSNMMAVFNDGEPGQSPARNLGVKHANGDIIGFTDDDVVLFSDWAEEMVKTYEDDSIIGVTGPAFPLWEDESMSWLPKEFHWIISCSTWSGWNGVRQVRQAGGMNMSFRKEAFNYCHFSDAFGHTAQEGKKVGPVVDDAEFSINLRLKTGKLILYNPSVRVQHKVYPYRLSRRFIRGQAYWQGYSKALLRRIYRDDADTRGLVRERILLRRILLKLLPSTLIGFFRHPSIAAKRLRLTVSVLFHVGLGYFSAALPALGTITRKIYGSS
jgi:glycosyltransferase involved in cell wall biosynthesis